MDTASFAADVIDVVEAKRSNRDIRWHDELARSIDARRRREDGTPRIIAHIGAVQRVRMAALSAPAREVAVELKPVLLASFAKRLHRAQRAPELRRVKSLAWRV